MQRALVVLVAAALASFSLPAVSQSDAATATATTTATAMAAARGATGIGAQQPGIAFEASAKRDHDLDVIANAGMTWVRADFYWSAIQGGGRNSFAWGSTDAFVKAATARGLHVLALAAYSPAWARNGTSGTYPPNDPRDYATFVHAAAERYAPMGLHAWEIWNEPNVSRFWSPKADPTAYAALLKLAYPAIKSADPKAVVVSGGLSPSLDTAKDLSPMSFLFDMYVHGAKGRFDAAGYHPYSYPYAPMFKAAWNTFYRTPDFHAIMTAFGDGAKAVWGTEVGYPTGTSTQAVTEQRQAANLVAAIDQWKAWTFTGPLIVFTVRDASSNAATVDDNMGMLRVNGVAKPSYAAIRLALRGGAAQRLS
jgi:aryl-phospho-beta-D-glucosidase BglC (GH1 family)